MRPETLLLLGRGKKNRESLHDIDLGNEFVRMKTKAQTRRAKIEKWDYIKLKSLCTAKETIEKVKRQPTEWKNVFAKHVSDKGLIS